MFLLIFSHATEEIIIPVFKLLRIILENKPLLTEQFISAGILKALLDGLETVKSDIRKEAAGLLVTLASIDKKEVGMLIKGNIIQRLNILANTDSYDIRRDCVLTISIIINNIEDIELIKELLSIGVIDTISKMLSGNYLTLLLTVMQALSKLLKYGKDYFLDAVLLFNNNRTM